ncbi:MAG: disulfide bond formation protein B [Thermomicrobiales bacterium]
MLALDPTFRRTETLAASFVLLVGLATILSAWGFQIIGGFEPCALCLEQRIPYYVALPLVLVSLVSAWIDRPAWLARGTLAMAGLVFLYGAYLGIHHAGVEWKWWAGPNDCAVGGAMPMTADNLLEQLESVRIVSCTEASWRFPAGWGLSFAGWNAVISLVLGIVAIAAAARKRDAT